MSQDPFIGYTWNVHRRPRLTNEWHGMDNTPPAVIGTDEWENRQLFNTFKANAVPEFGRLISRVVEIKTAEMKEPTKLLKVHVELQPGESLPFGGVEAHVMPIKKLYVEGLTGATGTVVMLYKRSRTNPDDGVALITKFIVPSALIPEIYGADSSVDANGLVQAVHGCRDSVYTRIVNLSNVQIERNRLPGNTFWEIVVTTVSERGRLFTPILVPAFIKMYFMPPPR